MSYAREKLFMHNKKGILKIKKKKNCDQSKYKQLIGFPHGNKVKMKRCIKGREKKTFAKRESKEYWDEKFSRIIKELQGKKRVVILIKRCMKIYSQSFVFPLSVSKIFFDEEMRIFECYEAFI